MDVRDLFYFNKINVEIIYFQMVVSGCNHIGTISVTYESKMVGSIKPFNPLS